MKDSFGGHSRHHVDGLVKANQHRMRLNNSLQRLLVSGGNFVRQRRIGDAIQRVHNLHIALARRCPVELSRGNMLFFQVITKHRDTDVDDVQWLGKQ